ncbi:WYL domain-containing protein [Saccharopolyspora sp. NFXS83]|uniref:helix-turn-helix transcriptional regulator n=1 Tax=Saccharopolyspora sp. NFXS83 TaxID=2993560 RepID=UPI00224B63DB|nr:WYL domain-containing protein [Saccharopolyspora sp. NFXS83]MCX2731544.1 WYL domain-containing protein [Saccharopolyspora sp. NFXS83]
MIGTSSRLLRLLSLLSSRPSWTAGELARRMEVTDRTVRRDVSRLRDLGYDVESDPGRWGGYRLRPGNKQIPLVLDDEESLAVAVALREAARTGVLGDDQAVLSAFLKLRQLLPARVASQLGAMDDVFEHTARAGGQPLSAGLLAGLAAACRRSERLRLSYRDMRGSDSERAVDPHRLVFTGNRWYLVARDVERGAWRTFRADRVLHAEPTGRVVRIDDPPAAARLVAETLTSDYPLYAKVRLHVALDEAMRAIPPTAGVHRADGPGATVVEVGGTDVESLATRLVKLGVPLTVLSPAEVRAAVRRHALALAETNEPGEG